MTVVFSCSYYIMEFSTCKVEVYLVVKKHYSMLAESLLNRFEVIPFYDIPIANDVDKINI